MRTLAFLLALAVAITALPLGAHAAEPKAVRLVSVVPIEADRTVPLAGTPVNVPTTGGWIGPGAHLLITFDSDPGNLYGCTGNFLWRAGAKTYLGAAGHCYIPPSATATHGPGANYNPAGTHVRVCVSGCEFGGQSGFFVTGTTVAIGPVAYGRQTAADGDVGNDFGLAEIPSAQLARATPTMPVWNGPLVATGAHVFDAACFYGNAAGLGEVAATKARGGALMGLGPKSWTADLASFEGDSGSAVETCVADARGVHGKAAVGVLTHLVIGGSLIAGTTVARAQQMALEAGLAVTPVTSAV